MKLFKTSSTLPKGRQKINKKKLLEAAEKVGKILGKERNYEPKTSRPRKKTSQT